MRRDMGKGKGREEEGGEGKMDRKRKMYGEGWKEKGKEEGWKRGREGGV